MNGGSYKENSIETCSALYSNLINHLAGLKKMYLSNRAYLADIEAVNQSQEIGFNEGRHQLAISHYEGHDAIEPLLNSYADLMRRTAKSSLFAKQFAGFVTVEPTHPCLQLIQKINSIKDEIACCVRDIRTNNAGQLICDSNGRPVHNRNHQQKHEFIHKAIPDVITAQCYRHIPVVRNDVRRISFYWATKHVHKTLTHEKAIQHLSYYLELLNMPERLKATLSELDAVADMHLYLPKLQTNSVMATFNFVDGTRKNVHCTVPVIIACEGRGIIKYKPLAQHEPTTNDYKAPKDAKLICPVTNLYARPRKTENQT